MLDAATDRKPGARLATRTSGPCPFFHQTPYAVLQALHIICFAESDAKLLPSFFQWTSTIVELDIDIGFL
jgi:hypothetical protein